MAEPIEKIVLSPIATSAIILVDRIPAPDDVKSSAIKDIEKLGKQLADVQTALEREISANLRLSATVSFLENQNGLLMSENATLSESLSVFIRTPTTNGSSTVDDKFASTNIDMNGNDIFNNEEISKKDSANNCSSRSDDWKNATDLKGRVDALLRCITGSTQSTPEQKRDALMLHTIESLSALVHLATTLAPPPPVGEESEEDIRKEELDMTLRQTFANAAKILTDVLINPAGKETYELLEPFPKQWLLNRFPYKRSVQQFPGGDDEPSRGGDAGMIISEGVANCTDSWLPLHWCMASEDPDPIDVEVLMDELAETAFTRDVSPLCIAVSRGIPAVAGIMTMIEKNPDVSSTADADGSYPLMHACASNEDCDIVKLLYDAYPAAVSEFDKAGFRAINYAAFSGYPKVVRYLLSVHPRSASLTAKNGSTALHDAAENSLRGGLEMVDEIFQANTTAIMQADDDGALPMHRAARCGSLEVVQFLHQLYPKAITTEDREGLLPMHYASQRSDKDLNLEVVQYLVTHA